MLRSHLSTQSYIFVPTPNSARNAAPGPSTQSPPGNLTPTPDSAREPVLAQPPRGGAVIPQPLATAPDAPPSPHAILRQSELDSPVDDAQATAFAASILVAPASGPLQDAQARRTAYPHHPNVRQQKKAEQSRSAQQRSRVRQKVKDAETAARILAIESELATLKRDHDALKTHTILLNADIKTLRLANAALTAENLRHRLVNMRKP